MYADLQTVQLLAFELSARRLAVHVEHLVTIVRAVAITQLPHAPAFVDGIINLRGQIVPVIDLRRRFGLAPVPLTPDQRFIVVTGSPPLALRVDRVDEVFVVPRQAIEAADRVIPGAMHAAGVVRLADGVIVIQDLDALLSAEEESRLAAALGKATA